MSAGARATREALTEDQRRMLVGVCIVIGAIAVVPSTYDFVINPLVDGLGGSDAEVSLLRQLPSVAAVLVIFLAPVLAARFGSQRLIAVAAVFFTIGCATVATAPTLTFATLGLVLIASASSILAVVVLGMLSATVVSARSRASAFAGFALVAPVVYMAMPVLAGYLLDHTTWRAVATTWVVAGVVMIVTTRRLFAERSRTRRSQGWLIPALAGLTLAALVQTFTALSNASITSPTVIVRAAIALASGAVLIWLHRRTPDPPLPITALRSGGAPMLFVVVIVVPFVNLWYYMTLAYQYVFGYSAMQTALLMVVPQLAGVVGALAARAAIQRRGITITGTTMLGGLAASLLLTLLIGTATSTWLIVLIMCVYAFSSVAAGVAVTNAVMNTAPTGGEADVSSYRGAAIHAGTAIGIVVMSTVVYAAAVGSFNASVADSGLDQQESEQIAEGLRSGETSQQVGSLYAAPASDVAEVDTAQQKAMIDGLHAHGLYGAAFIGFAAAVFAIGRRRKSASSSR